MDDSNPNMLSSASLARLDFCSRPWFGASHGERGLRSLGALAEQRAAWDGGDFGGAMDEET